MQPSMTVPIMVEAQFYEEDSSEFRLSVRAPPCEHMVVALVQILQLFMYPKNVWLGFQSSLKAEMSL